MKKKSKMDFSDYYKKMCGTSDTSEVDMSFTSPSSLKPFNKKELRWLKEQLESCIEWDDDSTSRSKRINYEKMLEKVNERISLL